MAPSDEGKDRKGAEDNATNPFISFRRFADEQVSNLLSNVFGLSSTFRPSSLSSDSSLQDYRAWLQGSRQSQQNNDREAEEAERIMDVYTRAHRDSAQTEITKAVEETDEPFRCPYRPDDQDVPQSEVLATLGEHLPPTILAAQVLGAQLSSVPIAYLLYSPYSPVRLEQQRALRDTGMHWREAFEDLLAVQNGEEISSECDHDPSVPSVDWVRRMIGVAMCKRDQDKDEEGCEANARMLAGVPGRRILLAASKLLQNDASEADECQPDEDCDQQKSDDEQCTELDLYKHFLSLQEISSSPESPSSEPSPPDSEPQVHPSIYKLLARHGFLSSSKSPSCEPSPLDSQPQSDSTPYVHLHDDSKRRETDEKKPSILSTLTTTERTTLPGGTTHTKVVLKKRFSDGREESTETLSTQNPLPKPQYQAPTRAIGDESADGNALRRDDKEKKSSGWFWS